MDQTGGIQSITTPNNLWRSLADTFAVLQLHRLEAKRMVWVLEHKQIGMVRVHEKGCCGLLADKSISEQSLQMCLDQCEQGLLNLS